MQVLINAGQANAATGDAGYADCLDSADAVAKALSISSDEVLPPTLCLLTCHVTYPRMEQLCILLLWLL